MKVVYGRVSTDDAQDPSLSIPCQLAKCNKALKPIGEKVDIAFLGRGERAQRRRQSAASRNWTHEVEMPADASRSTVSQMTADGTQIERRLEVDERHLQEETRWSAPTPDGLDLAGSTQMSEAPKPPKKAKKKPRASKEKARPLRINTTVYELGPSAPRAKELHERQVKAIALFLLPAVIKEWERRKGSSRDR